MDSDEVKIMSLFYFFFFDYYILVLSWIMGYNEKNVKGDCYVLKIVCYFCIWNIWCK